MQTSILRSILASFALLLFLASCRMTQDVEALYLPDREPWIPVHSADDGHATIVEYVPNGQTLEGWRELITVQAVDDRLPREAPLATMEKLRAAMQRHGGKLDWKVIESDANSVLYEWTLVGAPGQQDQGELARLVLGNDTTHRAAYAYKGLPLPAERREDRIALLRNARVVKGDKQYQAAVSEFFPDHPGGR